MPAQNISDARQQCRSPTILDEQYLALGQADGSVILVAEPSDLPKGTIADHAWAPTGRSGYRTGLDAP